MVDLKTFLSLAMPNQYCLRCHRCDIWGQEIPSIHFSYIQYYCTILYDAEKVCSAHSII